MANIHAWESLGAATLTAAPQSLTTLFPNLPADALVASVLIQSHEDNAAATLVFIGDSEMVNTGGNAGVVLKGPIDRIRFENQNGLNVFKPGDFYLFSTPLGGKIRVSLHSF